MDNLKKFNFTELDSAEMKQVQGGDLYEDILAQLKALGISVPPAATLAELLRLLFGGS